MGPDDLPNVIGTATIELPFNIFEIPPLDAPVQMPAVTQMDVPETAEEENSNRMNADSLISNHLDTTMMPGVPILSTISDSSLNYRLNILDQIEQMPKEEKRMMLLMLLDAFDDLIPEKTEATRKILKVNRLKQIFGKPKDSASQNRL